MAIAVPDHIRLEIYASDLETKELAEIYGLAVKTIQKIRRAGSGQKEAATDRGFGFVCIRCDRSFTNRKDSDRAKCTRRYCVDCYDEVTRQREARSLLVPLKYQPKIFNTLAFGLLVKGSTVTTAKYIN